ncbi:MAG: hypothetical protein AB7D06_11235 [Pedobacter sp.]
MFFGKTKPVGYAMVWLGQAFEFVVIKITSDRYCKILNHILKGLFSRRYTQMNTDKSFQTLQAKKVCIYLRQSAAK